MHPQRLRSPFAALLEVRAYQLVHGPGHALHARIVPSPSAGRDLVERVRGALVHELADAGVRSPRVDVEPVAELEREPGHAAKLKLVVSAR